MRCRRLCGRTRDCGTCGPAPQAAIGIFGLALIARDDLLFLIASGFSQGAGWVVYRTLL
jgi:hypothetical protein